MALLRSTATAAAAGVRAMSNKVAVLGAAGGIGQPLSLLLKMNPSIENLSVFDVVNAPGVAADLSHCDTGAKVTGHGGMDELEAALEGATHVIIPAGVPRKDGMTRDDLFNVNASITQTLAEAVAKVCPDAFVGVISNPVNSTVPIFKATLEKAGVYNKNKLAGITTLDVLRSNTFVAESQGFDVAKTDVTVIGGHAGITILPLLSQVSGARFSPEERDALIHRIQFGGDEVVKAKSLGSGGSATLSMALAAAKFTDGLLNNKTMCAYVDSDLVPGCDFFASPVKFGEDGIEEILGFGTLDATEQAWFDKFVPDLQAQIAKGQNFVAAN